MAVHDWTRVSAGTFHDFHNAWITELRNAFNGGLLPPGFYAQGEQWAGDVHTDVLTLHAGQAPQGPMGGGIATLEKAPPRVARHVAASEAAHVRAARRTLVIRHASNHRVIALLEILSPANKDRPSSISDFVEKAVSALRQEVHVLVVDLFPPGSHDPQGMHAKIWEDFGDALDAPPVDKPLMLASYVAGSVAGRLPEAYLEFAAVGIPLPAMPLFLDSHAYINVPLAPTYASAYRGVPQVWREILERVAPME